MRADKSHALLWHGVFLFLLGLLTGLATGAMSNPRMGVSAHVEAVLNGMFLVVLGLLWHRLRLPAGWLTALFWLALYGAYVNWASTLAAAIFGTGRTTPIAGAGHHGAAWQENLVDAGLYSLSVAMLAVSVIVLFGLRPGADRPDEESPRHGEHPR